ncbi:NERD domain-containing protein [Bacillus sp. KH172YL63]|uniref:NERD domain-containing protein n=1 Tax=Bacillus sp. KH172YL63 TaxID=2709784 RepID=UPI0013E43FA7|nr:NERD domain-containing protein [Bacillus sp. KH172YL63]BCB05731.1 DNA-binding protein [Bacillus sp. KH172YL63]
MSYLFLSLLLLLAVFASSPKVKGKIGEGKVRYFLGKLDPERYVVVHDLLLHARDGRTTQIDHVVIGEAGIFVIETKNYRGWIFGSEHNNKWTQVLNRRKSFFQNPLHQNYGHIKAIEQIIGSSSIQPAYYSIIAFDPKATIKKMEVTSPHAIVTYSNQVVKEIERQEGGNLTAFQIKGITQLLQKRNIVEKGAGKEHIKRVRSDQQEKKMKVKAGICPKCGNPLVTRIRKDGKGSFKGCSSFPQCRFIA